jgi:hypothetical protein
VFDELKKSLELHGSVRVWLGVAANDAADTPAPVIGEGNVTANSSSSSSTSGSSSGSSSKRARTDTPPLDPAGPSAASLVGALPAGRLLTADVTAPLCSPCWRLLPNANALQVLMFSLLPMR